MANQYVDFLFDEYEGRTVYILEAFLFDGDYGTNENLERDEGWYDCLLKISAGGESSRVYYVIMTHTKGDFFMIGNIIDISEVEYFRDMDWIGNINMRKIHNSHTFVF